MFDIPGQPGASMGVLNLRRDDGQGSAAAHQDAHAHRAGRLGVLIAEESDKLVDQERPTQEAIARPRTPASSSSTRSTRSPRARGPRRRRRLARRRAARPAAADRGHHGLTKHGPVKTDHVLFIASGAFHIAKPSDLLPELQGRLPIRVELKALTPRRHAPHPDRAGGH